VVPLYVNLYFYTDDAVLLKGNMGMAVEDRLTTRSLNTDLAKAKVKTVHPAFAIVPNYTEYGSHAGDTAFQFQTGVCCVGTAKGSPGGTRVKRWAEK